jgi:hypothetical protein
MRRYYVRAGQTHALIETDKGILAAIALFDRKIHPLDFAANVEARELTNHVREQKESA